MSSQNMKATPVHMTEGIVHPSSKVWTKLNLVGHLTVNREMDIVTHREFAYSNTLTICGHEDKMDNRSFFLKYFFFIFFVFWMKRHKCTDEWRRSELNDPVKSYILVDIYFKCTPIYHNSPWIHLVILFFSICIFEDVHFSRFLQQWNTIYKPSGHIGYNNTKNLKSTIIKFEL